MVNAVADYPYRTVNPEDFDVQEIIRQFEAQAKGLPADARNKFLAHIRGLAGQITQELRQLRLQKCSGEKVKQEADKLFAQLKTSGAQFLEECRHFDTRTIQQNQKFDDFEKRLSKMTLEPKEFTPPPAAPRDFDFDLMSDRTYRFPSQDKICKCLKASNLLKDSLPYFEESKRNTIIEKIAAYCQNQEKNMIGVDIAIANALEEGGKPLREPAILLLKHALLECAQPE